MTDFLGNSPLPDDQIVGEIVIPCISPVPADRSLSLTQIRNFARAGIVLASLAPDGWLKSFLGLAYDGDQADAREQLGAETAGAAEAQIAPVASALTDLVSSLHAVAFSGSLGDLSMPELQEQMLLAANPAEVRAAIGAAPGGGTWRYLTSEADNVAIPILATDTHVLIDAGGWGRLRINMPFGLYDTQEIKIATTGSVDALYTAGGETVIEPTPYDVFPGGLASTFVWMADQGFWVRFGR